MRRSIALIVLCLLAMGVGVGLFQEIVKHNYRFDTIRHLPEIQAFTIYGEDFVSTQNLDLEKRTALLFFHPECEYCRKEIEGIIVRHRECSNIQWLFITLAPTDVVEEFMIEYPLQSIPNSYVLREDWPDTFEQFGVKAPPALFIYDKSGNLMTRYMGATSIKTIIQALQ